MELLKFSALLFVSFYANAAEIPPTFKAPEGQKFCQTSKEFKKAVQFLRAENDLGLTDPQVVPLALEIAKGCDGAAERFAKVYLLLKKSGVDQVHSLKTAMTFTSLPSSQADGFIAVFKKVFLANYLNLDFANAFKLSLAMSRDYHGDPKKLADDFVALVDFCLSDKGLALDFKSCAEVTLAMVKFTDLYPRGIFPEFKKVYTYLRFDKKTGMTTGDALRIAPRIFAKGATAPENFIETMKFLNDKGPKAANQAAALETALQVADSSMVPVPESERATK